MPVMPDHKDAPTQVGSVGYVIMKDSKHLPEAKEMFKYLISAEAMTKSVSQFMPTRRSVLDSEAFAKAVPVASAAGIKAAIIDPMAKEVKGQPLHPQWEAINLKVTSNLDLFLTQSLGPKEVLEKIDTEVKKELK